MRQRYPEPCFNVASGAVPFSQALDDLLRWVGQLLGLRAGEIRQDDFLLVTCGEQAPRRALPRQCATPGAVVVDGEVQRLLLGRWCDIRQAYAEHGGSIAGGLRAMLRHMGLRFAGQRGLGMDAALGLAALARALIALGRRLTPTTTLNAGSDVMSKAEGPYMSKARPSSQQPGRPTTVKRGNLPPPAITKASPSGAAFAKPMPPAVSKPRWVADGSFNSGGRKRLVDVAPLDTVPRKASMAKNAAPVTERLPPPWARAAAAAAAKAAAFQVSMPEEELAASRDHLK